MASTFPAVSLRCFLEQHTEVKSFTAGRGACSTGDPRPTLAVANHDDEVRAGPEKKRCKPAFQGAGTRADHPPRPCIGGFAALEASKKGPVLAGTDPVFLFEVFDQGSMVDVVRREQDIGGVERACLSVPKTTGVGDETGHQQSPNFRRQGLGLVARQVGGNDLGCRGHGPSKGKVMLPKHPPVRGMMVKNAHRDVVRKVKVQLTRGGCVDGDDATKFDGPRGRSRHFPEGGAFVFHQAFGQTAEVTTAGHGPWHCGCETNRRGHRIHVAVGAAYHSDRATLSGRFEPVVQRIEVGFTVAHADPSMSLRNSS